jgi:hypothetical protein
MRKFLFVAFLAAVGFTTASGCAPSHAGRTVGKGILQAEGSVGGPFVTNLGAAVPVPNVPVGARYGITDRVDISSHVNLLPIFLGGFLALDGSLTWGLIQHQGRRGWNLATGTGFIFFTDFQEGARISPLIDLAGGYTVDWLTPFAGFEMAPDFWGGNVVSNYFAGFEADIGKLTLSAAGVWFYPSYDWYASPIRYVSADYQGSIGVLVGIKYKFDTIISRGGRR